MARPRDQQQSSTRRSVMPSLTPIFYILAASGGIAAPNHHGANAFIHPQTATWRTTRSSAATDSRTSKCPADVVFLKDTCTSTTRLDVSAVLEAPTVGLPDDGNSNNRGFVSSFDYTVGRAVDLPWMDYVDNASLSSSSALLPPVIFLHGLLGNKRNFQTLASGLGASLQRERRLIGMDLRNHGDNIDMMDSMAYSDMATDVLDTLDRHILASASQKVILVGHSMGAKVAQALALLNPDRVEGMVLLDMAPVTYDHEEPSWKTVSDILHLLKDIVPPSLESPTKRQVDQLLQPSLPDPALRAFCLTNWDAAKSDWKIDLTKVCSELDTLRQFQLSSEEETCSDLQFDGDVLLIHGGKSKFVKSTHLPTIKSYFPNHMLTTIRGAGHWVHAEAPEDVMLMLKRYLDR